jgi:putative FmdB family regulatory protein
VLALPEGGPVPTYEYACTECGDQTEVVQKFTDDPLTVCNMCGGRLRKVFSPVGIVFKGSGFYRTDSRAASKELAGSAQKANGEAGSKPPGDSKPGEPAAAKAAGNGSPAGGDSGSGGSTSSGSGAASGSGSPPAGKPASAKVA